MHAALWADGSSFAAWQAHIRLFDFTPEPYDRWSSSTDKYTTDTKNGPSFKDVHTFQACLAFMVTQDSLYFRDF